VPLGFVCAALFILLARPVFWTLVTGGVISLVGLALRAWAAGHIRKNDRLATSGPYAHTRNPLYLGSFLLGLGFTVAAGRPLMRVESATLAGLFGGEFERYARAVPLFVPRLTPYDAGGESVRFDASLYMRYREYRASVGFAVALALLAFKDAGLQLAQTVLAGLAR
jgi:protein-S-isoprenylcysteine O-methyltransferase Ste14